MRRLLAWAMRLALVWCAWWVTAALGLHLAVPRLAGADPGTEVTLAGVGGFPGTFAVDLTGVRLADTGIEWSAGEVAVTARAWNPAHVDVVLPPEHELRLGAERLTLRTASNRGEIDLLPTPALTFRGLALDLSGAEVVSNRGWGAAAERLEIAARRGEGKNAYLATADIAALLLPTATKFQLDPTGLVPDAIGAVRLDATITFDQPWNRYTVEGVRPQPIALDLRDAGFVWGDVELAASGTLTIADGVPEGTIRLTTPDWRKVHAFAAANGMLREEDAGTWWTALSVLSLGGEALNLPVVFQGGFMSWGPIPGGPAPRIVIP